MLKCIFYEKGTVLYLSGFFFLFISFPEAEEGTLNGPWMILASILYT